MALLADLTDAKTNRFSGWKANQLLSIVHKDAVMSDRFGIHKPSQFNFFQTGTLQTITSAVRFAQLIDMSLKSISSVESKQARISFASPTIAILNDRLC